MGSAAEDDVAVEKVTALFKTEKAEGWDEWEVLEMDVREKLGQPTYGELVIAATTQRFDFSPLLGKSCVLVLSRGRDRRRYFKGLVFRVEQRGEYPFGSVARVDFATAMWAMRHGQDSRVFENQTAPQILEEVLREALTPFRRMARLNLSRAYAVREYCVQYKESDWSFAQRLMTDEGITFYIDDGEDEAAPETVVLVDSNDSFPEIETMGPRPPAAQPTQLADSREQQWELWLERSYHDEDPIQRAHFEVELSDGQTIEGHLGGDGKAQLAGLSAKPKRVRFGPDARPYERADQRENVDYRGGFTEADADALVDRWRGDA